MQRILILASQSPRRREILTFAGIPFEVRVSGVPEVRNPSESASAYVQRLAREKALAVPRHPGEIVLAADTTVVIPGAPETVLEKPENPQDAARMMRLLSGRRHDVLTGICLTDGDRTIVDVSLTRVEFLPLSETEIEQYVASGEPMDKAGGYAIQGQAAKFVKAIEGCYFNVMGLPVSLVYQKLKQFGDWEVRS